MPVDRCICHNILFKEIKRIADERGFTTLEELQDAKISSTSCQLCLPYVKQVLKTGKTSFRPGIYLDEE
ncbi:MAG: (2Fe-2S)-binding protein [Balneolaceae bacterium]|nr:(2Fe-2S)-binding protein [Balneolaceae bacterium]